MLPYLTSLLYADLLFLHLLYEVKSRILKVESHQEKSGHLVYKFSLNVRTLSNPIPHWEKEGEGVGKGKEERKGLLHSTHLAFHTFLHSTHLRLSALL